MVKGEDGENKFTVVNEPPVYGVPDNPLPETRPHVLANIALNDELEWAYLDGDCDYPESVSRKKSRGNSSIAHKRFFSSSYKTKEEYRCEFFEELTQANIALEALKKKPVEKAETYEDIILKFGGRFVGESQVARRGKTTTVLNQT